jgi:protein-tyrosine-phosphatase
MASALFLYKIEQEYQAYPWIVRSWQVESAGTWAVDGERAAERAQEVMQQKGLDIRNHRSRAVNRDLLARFSLILTMEKSHKEALQVEFPELAKRIFLLSEMVGNYDDIHDPVSGTLADYRAAADELDQLIDKGFDKICQLAQENV